jgi:uroporphyrin-III C-methyltransferase/precorrin-2 dehydrogenase/sirohydrochlorin ferrochelatase
MFGETAFFGVKARNDTRNPFDMTSPAFFSQATDAAATPALASLPVFFDLAGRRVVLAASSDAAVWKTELFYSTGAEVDLYCAAPGEGLKNLAAQSPRLRLIPRLWQQDDLIGAALAIGVFDEAAEAEAFHKAARGVSVPVNCADRPAFCDFQIGAIVNRSPLVIGISTHGAAPSLARAIRGRLDTLLPQGLRHWTAAAAAWRPYLKSLQQPARARSRFWELFAEKAIASGSRTPSDQDLSHLLNVAQDAANFRGSVALVGAGPGDPELITLKALRALHTADVVLYDDLVAPGVIDMARREATKIPVGKRGYKPSCRQDHITALLVKLAREGNRVVRLKGGDPSIFGRANEELAALREAGIPVEIIPGVTAALGAAASLQISLTERELSRRVQFITAHARDGKLPDDIDWRSICDPRAATVVYMCVRTLEALSQRLIAEGIDRDIPAILIERATWPDEHRVYGTISDLPAKVAAISPDGPCLVMIGAIFAGEKHIMPGEVARIESVSLE